MDDLRLYANDEHIDPFSDGEVLRHYMRSRVISENPLGLGPVTVMDDYINHYDAMKAKLDEMR